MEYLSSQIAVLQSFMTFSSLDALSKRFHTKSAHCLLNIDCVLQTSVKRTNFWRNQRETVWLIHYDILSPDFIGGDTASENVTDRSVKRIKCYFVDETTKLIKTNHNLRFAHAVTDGQDF